MVSEWAINSSTWRNARAVRYCTGSVGSFSSATVFTCNSPLAFLWYRYGFVRGGTVLVHMCLCRAHSGQTEDRNRNEPLPSLLFFLSAFFSRVDEAHCIIYWWTISCFFSFLFHLFFSAWVAGGSEVSYLCFPFRENRTLFPDGKTCSGSAADPE